MDGWHGNIVGDVRGVGPGRGLVARIGTDLGVDDAKERGLVWVAVVGVPIVDAALEPPDLEAALSLVALRDVRITVRGDAEGEAALLALVFGADLEVVGHVHLVRALLARDDSVWALGRWRVRTVLAKLDLGLGEDVSASFIWCRRCDIAVGHGLGAFALSERSAESGHAEKDKGEHGGRLHNC